MKTQMTVGPNGKLIPFTPLRLTITRTWKPVTATVESCDMCPWFARERDGNATLPLCQNPKYSGGKGGYDAVLGDETLISDLCPERPNA
jgi:hypothetical protein